MLYRRVNGAFVDANNLDEVFKVFRSISNVVLISYADPMIKVHQRPTKG
jgi:hypothetical protein